jgi:hypothetical protein
MSHIRMLDEALVMNKIKIFIKETFNRYITEYTLDSFEWDSYDEVYKFKNGRIILNSRLGNFKITVSLSDIKKYFKWRNKVYLPLRKEYIKSLPFDGSNLLRRSDIYDYTIKRKDNVY